jgi:hypothetical protein
MWFPKTDFTPLITELGRLCLPVAGGQPPVDEDASVAESFIGKVTLAFPCEAWPRSKDGDPLPPLVQLDLRVWPGRPDSLSDLEIITVFHKLYADVGLRNGQGWELRAYPDASRLVPLSPPAGVEPASPPKKLVWGLPKTDMPFPDDAPEDKYRLLQKYYRNFPNNEFCSSAVKLGGYPHITQWAIEFCDKVPNEEQIREYGQSLVDIRLPNPAHPRFAFQVGSMHELEFHYMDMGILYFGRGSGDHKDTWFMEGAGA